MIKMKPSEIKKLIISSLNADADPVDIPMLLENEGAGYDFGKGFTDAVLHKIVPVALKATKEIEFVRYMIFTFKSIAVSGIAAIIILLISILIREGSLSVNAFLGLKDNYDESIICLLTGN